MAMTEPKRGNAEETDLPVLEAAVGGVDGAARGRVAAIGRRAAAGEPVVVAEFGGGRAGDIREVESRIRQRMSSVPGASGFKLQMVRPGWLPGTEGGAAWRRKVGAKFLRLRAAQRTGQFCFSAFKGDLPEAAKDCFRYFGGCSRIATPFEGSCPGRVSIGNWTALGRYGQLMMHTDFSKAKDHCRQHYPEVPHDFDPEIYGSRDPYLTIGDGSNIGDYFFISCSRSIEIGRHVVISARVFIGDSHHNMENPDLPICLQSNSLGRRIIIGDHSWIGINCCILEGVRVGRHAVVGANSVVTTNVPDYAVFAGHPARLLRFLPKGRLPKR